MVAVAVGGAGNLFADAENGLNGVGRVATIKGVIRGEGGASVGRVLGVVNVGVEDVALLSALVYS